jgi:hypothetical protein
MSIDNEIEYRLRVCKKCTTKIEENFYISSQFNKKKKQDFDIFALLGHSAVQIGTG